jgi:hypothetical protein
MEKNNKEKRLNIILSLLGIASIMLSITSIIHTFQIDELERVCRPDAYYGASEHIINPECLPTDSRCVIDPCR